MVRLDPRYPVLWRTPTSVQLGADPGALVLDDVDAIDETVLHALQVGAPVEALGQIARLAGDADRAAALLDLMGHLLERPAALDLPPLRIAGGSASAGTVLGLLAGLGDDVTAGAPADSAGGNPAGTVGVLVADYVVPAAEYQPWLAADLPHLPIVVHDDRVDVGPLVVPGETPCLHCRDRARADADPTWRAVAAQLIDRRPIVTRLLVAEAALVAARMLSGRVDESLGGEGATVRMSESGLIDWVRPEFHPDCLCRVRSWDADSTPIRRGTASAADPERSTSAVPAAAWPA